MTDKAFNIFTKEELIKGIQSLPKYDRHQLVTNMLFEKQDALILEWGQNDEKLGKLNDELKKAKKNGEMNIYWDIYEEMWEYTNANNKIDRLLDMICKVFGEVTK